MTENTPQEIQQSGEKLIIEDLDQFARLMTDWHAHQVKALELLLTVADGVEVSLNDEAPLILTGDVRRAFVLGITTSLMKLGTLPFSPEPDHHGVPN